MITLQASIYWARCDSNQRRPGRRTPFIALLFLKAVLSLSLLQPPFKGASRVILATENDYCKLCDASFSSPAVAQAHYQGKNHAKRLRLAEAQQNATSLWVCHTHALPDKTDIKCVKCGRVCGRCLFLWFLMRHQLCSLHNSYTHMNFSLKSWQKGNPRTLPTLTSRKFCIEEEVFPISFIFRLFLHWWVGHSF